MTYLVGAAHLVEVLELRHLHFILRRLRCHSRIKLLFAHVGLRGRQLGSEGFAFARGLRRDGNLLLLLGCRIGVHAQSSPVLPKSLDAGVGSIDGILRLETPLESLRVSLRRVLVNRIVNLPSRID